MKRYFLLLLPILLFSCKKNNSTSPVIGTWKETMMINMAYNAANVATAADTIPVLTTGSTYYTEFMGNGHFASYTFTGSAKTEILDGIYTYNNATKTLSQTWQAGSSNTSNNIGRMRASAGQNGNDGYIYNILSFDGNILTLSVKIPDNVYGAYDGGQTASPGYTIQIRKLIRN
ncbi:hypothetical protein HQ865_05450 [Mucilaginibacter mali]|uniref:Lipocalin-like domain-containing protein n=1 Tax=Mucilaginibacter mali TaxID=2740462 RepID=A0A7D4UNQ5_9SPHI|nr:hypothetical protein [Mucilaginibacter mali]QKJ29220.1 hypothetical protein HQ865_05450 [Mucilaginibacter mali]